MAQLMPLPLTVSCFSKIQIGFTFLVPAHPGSPGKRAVKWVCVCVLPIQSPYFLDSKAQLVYEVFFIIQYNKIICIAGLVSWRAEFEAQGDRNGKRPFPTSLISHRLFFSDCMIFKKTNVVTFSISSQFS